MTNIRYAKLIMLAIPLLFQNTAMASYDTNKQLIQAAGAGAGAGTVLDPQPQRTGLINMILDMNCMPTPRQALTLTTVGLTAFSSALQPNATSAGVLLRGTCAGLVMAGANQVDTYLPEISQGVAAPSAAATIVATQLASNNNFCQMQ